jgi:hypothetical protein
MISSGPNTASPKPAQSSFTAFLEEHLSGRLLPLGLLVLAAALVVLYLLDLLPERWAGALLTVAVVLGASGLLASRLMPAARTAAGTLVVLAISAAVAFVAAAPILGDIFPGTPVAQATMRQVGDSMPLPAMVQGPVRVLAKTQPRGGGVTSCHLELAIGARTVPLDLGREMQSVRLGRRGRGTVLREHTTAYAHGSLTGGEHAVKLVHRAGSQDCDVALSLFRDQLPLGLQAGLAAGLVLIVAALGARARAGAVPAVAAGVALAFGLIAVVAATPSAVVRPAIGAMLGGLPVGSALGGGLSWLLSALVPGRARR